MSREQSILQKLKNKARDKRMPYQLVLQLFCQEEFLRRLSRTRYRDNFILKGGLFLFSYYGFEGRPTMDIDFLLRRLNNRQSDIHTVIKEIIETSTEYDFITYEIKDMENIAEQKEYHGLRVKLLGKIGNTRTPFDIDLGIGDVIVPEAMDRSIATQLHEFPQPIVKTYSLESTIAEKWEAMINRLEANSRMKDYYDIYFLVGHYDFDGAIIREAILKTLEKRGTVMNRSTLEIIAGIYQDEDMSRRWLAFTSKTLGVELEFFKVVNLIVEFVEKPALSIIEGREFIQLWSSGQRKYVE